MRGPFDQDHITKGSHEQPRRTLAAVLILADCANLARASDGTPPTTVEVKGIRNPELQPYRIMAAGFDAMDKHRALAPNAHALRFQLGARNNAPDGVMTGLALRIEGRNTDLAVPLDANHVFILPRHEAIADEDAQLKLNRNQRNIRWHPVIRSQGVPAGFMRLGDARMECQVMVSVVKKIAGFMLSTAVNGLMGASDWCSVEKFTIPTFATERLVSATLLHEGERITLRLSEDNMGFYAPVREARYGNDDLIELMFADASPGP